MVVGLKGGSKVYVLLVVCILVVVVSAPAVPYTRAWWDVGHRALTSKAIDFLPDKWRNFFKHYEDFLKETCVWPDTVLAREAGESYNHYYDSEFPMERHIKDPSKGRLPWRVAELMDNLTNYIKQKNWYKVLETAGILSHYLADSAQPYHSTSDYNPPITSNVSAPGVRPKHALLEGTHAEHIDEIIPPNLNITPTYIKDPLRFMFDFLNESRSFLPEMNSILLGQDITDPSDDKDWPEIKPILENRSIRAIWLIASMWYTAIVDADAIDAAPDPNQFTKLSVEVSGLQPPQKPSPLYITIKIKDDLGVPIRPDQITFKLDNNPIEIKESDLGEYTVKLTSDLIKGLSGKTVEVSISVTKDGYEPASYTDSVTFPQYEEPTGGGGELDTSMIMYAIAAVAVIVVVMLAVFKMRK